jgi:hypothetical protein
MSRIVQVPCYNAARGTTCVTANWISSVLNFLQTTHGYQWSACPPPSARTTLNDSSASCDVRDELGDLQQQASCHCSGALQLTEYK